MTFERTFGQHKWQVTVWEFFLIRLGKSTHLTFRFFQVRTIWGHPTRTHPDQEVFSDHWATFPNCQPDGLTANRSTTNLAQPQNASTCPVIGTTLSIATLTGTLPEQFSPTTTAIWTDTGPVSTRLPGTNLGRTLTLPRLRNWAVTWSRPRGCTQVATWRSAAQPLKSNLKK